MEVGVDLSQSGEVREQLREEPGSAIRGPSIKAVEVYSNMGDPLSESERMKTTVGALQLRLLKLHLHALGGDALGTDILAALHLDSMLPDLRAALQSEGIHVSDRLSANTIRQLLEFEKSEKAERARVRSLRVNALARSGMSEDEYYECWKHGNSTSMSKSGNTRTGGLHEVFASWGSGSNAVELRLLSDEYNLQVDVPLATSTPDVVPSTLVFRSLSRVDAMIGRDTGIEVRLPRVLEPTSHASSALLNIALNRRREILDAASGVVLNMLTPGSLPLRGTYEDSDGQAVWITCDPVTGVYDSERRLSSVYFKICINLKLSGGSTTIVLMPSRSCDYALTLEDGVTYIDFKKVSPAHCSAFKIVTVTDGDRTEARLRGMAYPRLVSVKMEDRVERVVRGGATTFSGAHSMLMSRYLGINFLEWFGYDEDGALASRGSYKYNKVVDMIPNVKFRFGALLSVARQLSIRAGREVYEKDRVKRPDAWDTLSGEDAVAWATRGATVVYWKLLVTLGFKEGYGDKPHPARDFGFVNKCVDGVTTKDTLLGAMTPFIQGLDGIFYHDGCDPMTASAQLLAFILTEFYNIDVSKSDYKISQYERWKTAAMSGEAPHRYARGEATFALLRPPPFCLNRNRKMGLNVYFNIPKAAIATIVGTSDSRSYMGVDPQTYHLKKTTLSLPPMKTQFVDYESSTTTFPFVTRMGQLVSLDAIVSILIQRIMLVDKDNIAIITPEIAVLVSQRTVTRGGDQRNYVHVLGSPRVSSMKLYESGDFLVRVGGTSNSLFIPTQDEIGFYTTFI